MSNRLKTNLSSGVCVLVLIGLEHDSIVVLDVGSRLNADVYARKHVVLESIAILFVCPSVRHNRIPKNQNKYS